MQGKRLLALAALALTVVHGQSARAIASGDELTVFTNEHQSVVPGYALGDVAIGNPKIADFKVMPGRREVLVFGKGIGGTSLTLWDQKKVKRDSLVITVMTRQASENLTTVGELLRDFPSVSVRNSMDGLILSGIVSSKDDQAAIEKMASAFKAKSVVRYVAPPLVVPPSAPGGLSSPWRAVNDEPVNAVLLEYEVELLETSSGFRSGSYATGVEPSGRSLAKHVVRAQLGSERELFIGGPAVSASKDGGTATKSPQTGLRLTLRPTAEAKAKFKTTILVETNLPFSGETFDPTVWRRARWEFTAQSGEPFGITGADLLATPDANQPTGSKWNATTRTVTTFATVPGASAIPGAEYVPVFGSLFGSKPYKKKATQLLVILRPRVIQPRS